jgi:hypothetical protein
MKTRGLKFILLGFFLVVFGAVAPFVMVINVVRASFWLSILAYSASVSGLFLGMFGAIEINYENLDR